MGGNNTTEIWRSDLRRIHTKRFRRVGSAGRKCLINLFSIKERAYCLVYLSAGGPFRGSREVGPVPSDRALNSANDHRRGVLRNCGTGILCPSLIPVAVVIAVGRSEAFQRKNSTTGQDDEFKNEDDKRQ